MDMLITLLSPFILLGIIIIAICGMAGIKPDLVLRPVFGLMIELIKVSFQAFIMIVKLIGSSSAQVSAYQNSLPKNNGYAGKVDPSRIRIVVLDDKE